MLERRTDRKTRELIDHIDEHLREAERLRNEIADSHRRIWPDSRDRSRIGDVPYEPRTNDTSEATR